MDNLYNVFCDLRKKDDKFFERLDIILASKDPWYNYECARLCLTDPRIEPEKRDYYVNRHAQLVLEQGSLNSIFHTTRDIKSVDIFRGLNIILESKDSEFNYRCAKLCFKDTRIPPEERVYYSTRHAEVLFEKNDVEYMFKYLDKISRKPNYQEYLKSKGDLTIYYAELAKIKKEREEKRRIEAAERAKYLEKIGTPWVYKPSIQLQYGQLLEGATSTEEKSRRVLDSGNAYFNYRFVKETLKTTGILGEIKKQIVLPHIEFVLRSNDTEMINKLINFIQYKPLYQEYSRVRKIN